MTPPEWGSPTPDPSDPHRSPGAPVPRLWRSRDDRILAGVIGGLSEKYGWDPLPVRLLFSVLTAMSGGLLVVPYIAVWAITQAHGESAAPRRWWRSRRDKVIAGVLGGLADKFDTQPTFLRVLYTALTIVSGGFPGILLYLVLWAITPLEPDPHWEG